MDLVIGYVTTKDREEAKAIGRKLVEENLAACVNILDSMESIYRWENKIEESREAILLVKTRRALMAKVTEAVKKYHSYEVPCVVFLPTEGGNPTYLEWLQKNCLC